MLENVEKYLTAPFSTFISVVARVHWGNCTPLLLPQLTSRLLASSPWLLAPFRWNGMSLWHLMESLRGGEKSCKVHITQNSYKHHNLTHFASLCPAVSFTSGGLARSPPSLYPSLALKDQEKSLSLAKRGATMLQVILRYVKLTYFWIHSVCRCTLHKKNVSECCKVEPHWVNIILLMMSQNERWPQ